MSKSSWRVRGLALLAVVVAAPAAADFCPPLPVGTGDVCECKVHNYGTKDDTDIVITVYGAGGPVQTCGPFTLAAGTNQYCAFFFASPNNCGCAVTGESGKARTSLSVEDFVGSSAFASVGCR